MNPNMYAKAITAFLLAFGTLYEALALDGVVTGSEWVRILVGAAVAAGGVWAVPNTPPKEDVPAVNAERSFDE